MARNNLRDGPSRSHLGSPGGNSGGGVQLNRGIFRCTHKGLEL